MRIVYPPLSTPLIPLNTIFSNADRMHALQFQQVSFAYGSRHFSLADISCDIPASSFITLLGANGSGKTTLFRLACGMLAPSRGAILVHGANIATMQRNAAARTIAFVAQHQPPSIAMSVEEYIFLGRIPFAKTFAFTSATDCNRVEMAMELTDCIALRTARLSEISGGELQRVLVARAVAQEPKILLLDEPNSHLDIAHQLALFKALQTWRETTGGTVIASTHDFNLASMFSEYSIVLAGGKLVASGAPSEILTSALIKNVFGVHAEIINGVYGSAPAVQLRLQ